MKPIQFLLLLFVLNTLYAQNQNSDLVVGHLFDINKGLIPGYLDYNYEPDKKIDVSHNISNEYTPGYYIGLDSVRYNGFIKFNPYNEFFEFKLFYDEKKGFKFSAKDCMGLVVAKDSFIVSNKNILEYDSSKYVFLGRNQELIQFIERVDDMTFYKYYFRRKAVVSNFMPAAFIVYIIKRDSDEDFYKIPRGIIKFKNFGQEYFKDYPFIVDGIQKKRYTHLDTECLIKMVKYIKKYQNNEHVYFKNNWEETEEKEVAFYYAKILSIGDSTLHIKYFTIHDEPLYEGNFSHLYPHKNVGEVVFYRPDGSIRKKLYYKNYEPKLYVTYYPNESKHLEYLKNHNQVIYLNVYNEDGKNILDGKGTGFNKFYDPILKREITYVFKEQFLKSAYYMDKYGKRIYQVCSSNAKQKTNEKPEYPSYLVTEGLYGLVLAKVIVEPSGVISNIEVIHSPSFSFDKAIYQHLASSMRIPEWSPAKEGKTFVTQELVIPYNFNIITNSAFRGYFFNNSFFLPGGAGFMPNMFMGF